jgi:tRNA G37 N-methylase Trm5
MASIKIDKETHEKLAKRAMEKGFKTTDEYINSVLGQIVEKIEREVWGPKKEAMSKDEEEKVKSRLRALGYIE